MPNKSLSFVFGYSSDFSRIPDVRFTVDSVPGLFVACEFAPDVFGVSQSSLFYVLDDVVYNFIESFPFSDLTPDTIRRKIRLFVKNDRFRPCIDFFAGQGSCYWSRGLARECFAGDDPFPVFLFPSNFKFFDDMVVLIL